MINAWNNLDIQIKVAVISAVSAIVVAIITGVFSLIKKDTNSGNNKDDSDTLRIIYTILLFQALINSKRKNQMTLLRRD